MLRNLIRLAVPVALLWMAEALLSPPLSCWLTKGYRPTEDGGGGNLSLVQPGGAAGAAIRRLLEQPAETDGQVCRRRILHALGLG